MSPSFAPPVLSTATHGLSLRVVPARPDATGEAFVRDGKCYVYTLTAQSTTGIFADSGVIEARFIRVPNPVSAPTGDKSAG